MCVKVSGWMRETDLVERAFFRGVHAAGGGFSPVTLPGVGVSPFSSASLVISPVDGPPQSRVCSSLSVFLGPATHIIGPQ